jgi:SagB-type dehydrogenase family enzyme
MLPVDDPMQLSRLFHLNSEPWLNEQAYRGAPFAQEFKDHLEAARIPLPPPVPGCVVALAAARYSVRAFEPRAMSGQMLSDLLHAAYGIVDRAALEGGHAFLRRGVPSAGGLYPLELYLMIRNVTDLADGLYHFDAREPALELVRAGDWQAEAATIFYTWPFIVEANIVVCIGAVFPRSQKKYGPRGYRYILLEAGHVAQNLCLAAAEMGLATLCMGGFRDGALNRLIGLDPHREGVVYAVAAGFAMAP